MKWDKKVKVKTPLFVNKGPEIGDVKVVTRFAFFPIKIDKVKRVWLERYEKVYIYKNIYARRKDDEWMKNFQFLENKNSFYEYTDCKLIDKRYCDKPFFLKPFSSFSLDYSMKDKTLKERWYMALHDPAYLIIFGSLLFLILYLYIKYFL